MLHVDGETEARRGRLTQERVPGFGLSTSTSRWGPQGCVSSPEFAWLLFLLQRLPCRAMGQCWVCSSFTEGPGFWESPQHPTSPRPPLTAPLPPSCPGLVARRAGAVPRVPSLLSSASCIPFTARRHGIEPSRDAFKSYKGCWVTLIAHTCLTHFFLIPSWKPCFASEFPQLF